MRTLHQRVDEIGGEGGHHRTTRGKGVSPLASQYGSIESLANKDLETRITALENQLSRSHTSLPSAKPKIISGSSSPDF